VEGAEPGATARGLEALQPDDKDAKPLESEQIHKVLGAIDKTFATHPWVAQFGVWNAGHIESPPHAAASATASPSAAASVSTKRGRRVHRIANT
jgi:hypothetical protein